MDVFTYSYDCPRWYGRSQGTRNLYLDPMSTTEPIEAAKKRRPDNIRVTNV